MLKAYSPSLVENSPLYGCVLLEGPSSSPPTTDTQSRGTETSPSPTPLPPQLGHSR